MRSLIVSKAVCLFITVNLGVGHPRTRVTTLFAKFWKVGGSSMYAAWNLTTGQSCFDGANLIRMYHAEENEFSSLS